MDEVDQRSNESNSCNTGHDGDVVERITVELEPRWLGEEHGAHERALSGIETSSDHEGKRCWFIVSLILGSTRADNFGAAVQEMTSDCRMHG